MSLGFCDLAKEYANEVSLSLDSNRDIRVSMGSEHILACTGHVVNSPAVIK